MKRRGVCFEWAKRTSNTHSKVSYFRLIFWINENVSGLKREREWKKWRGEKEWERMRAKNGEKFVRIKLQNMKKWLSEEKQREDKRRRGGGWLTFKSRWMMLREWRYLSPIKTGKQTEDICGAKRNEYFKGKCAVPRSLRHFLFSFITTFSSSLPSAFFFLSLLSISFHSYTFFQHTSPSPSPRTWISESGEYLSNSNTAPPAQ